MARDFIDNIKAAMIGSGGIEDNSTGLVSPADVRVILTDMMDSLHDDEATLVATNTATLTVPATWGVIGGAGVYDTSTGDDSAGQGFLIVDQTAGTVTGKDTAGYSYKFQCSITVENATNGKEIDFSIGQNGSPVGTTSITGAGGNPVSRSWSGFIQTAGISDVFSIIWQDGDGGDSVDITSLSFYVDIKPTNNP